MDHFLSLVVRIKHSTRGILAHVPMSHVTWTYFLTYTRVYLYTDVRVAVSKSPCLFLLVKKIVIRKEIQLSLNLTHWIMLGLYCTAAHMQQIQQPKSKSDPQILPCNLQALGYPMQPFRRQFHRPTWQNNSKQCPLRNIYLPQRLWAGCKTSLTRNPGAKCRRYCRRLPQWI